MLVLSFAALTGCFGLSLGDEPFVCGANELCPSGYECVFNVCTRIGKPDAAVPDAQIMIDASCAANAFQSCTDSTHALVCNEDGTAIVEVACPGGCNGSTGVCVRCTPNTTTCVGDTRVVCDANGSVTSAQTCPAGCDPGEPAVCFHLVPSNLPATSCLASTDAELVITQNLELDTSACASFGGALVSPPDGPTVCALVVKKLLVGEGTRLRVTGMHPLAAVATDRIEIRGIVDVSGNGVIAGPGGALGPQPGKDTEAASNSGAGGAGFVTSGAIGGGGSYGSGKETAGGGNYGSEPLEPLWPGSRGGTAPPICVLGPCPFAVDVPRGGGGGGGLQLVACRQLEIGQLARINAGVGADTSASGGRGGTSASDPPHQGAAAREVANGGGGGGGGAAGRIRLNTRAEMPAVVAPGARVVPAPSKGTIERAPTP